MQTSDKTNAAIACVYCVKGWSGSAKMLGKLAVSGRPTNLDNSRIVGQGPIAFAVGAGWGLFGHFSLIYLFSFLSPSLWETA